MNFKIKNIKNKIKYGFIGMNKFASEKHLHIPYHYRENTILIYKNLPKDVRKNTIKHEEIELELMKNKNMEYKTAHKFALKHENDKTRLNKIIKLVKR